MASTRILKAIRQRVRSTTARLEPYRALVLKSHSFAQKQLGLTEKVYAVYEAGPLGYVLYRRLRDFGIEAYVSASGKVIVRKRVELKIGVR